MNQLPTSWIGVAALALLLVFNAWQSWQTSHTQKTVSKVNKQVSNGHVDSNLRDDIDALKSMMDDHRRDIQGLRSDIGSLRGEIREERRARGDLQQAVDRLEHERRSTPGKRENP